MSIRNTTMDDPMIKLVTAMSGGIGIEAQEAEGQHQLCASQQLPTDMGADVREMLEAAGAEFKGKCEGDPLFQTVVLPEGWRVQATDHSMWSHLLDANGETRARIFYKAAFYDRDASIYAA